MHENITRSSTYDSLIANAIWKEFYRKETLWLYSFTGDDLGSLVHIGWTQHAVVDELSTPL